MKRCRMCGESFPLDLFHVKGERMSGVVYRHSRCKQCATAERAFYRTKKRARAA